MYILYKTLFNVELFFVRVLIKKWTQCKVLVWQFEQLLFDRFFMGDDFFE